MEKIYKNSIWREKSSKNDVSILRASETEVVFWLRNLMWDEYVEETLSKEEFLNRYEKIQE